MAAHFQDWMNVMPSKSVHRSRVNTHSIDIFFFSKALSAAGVTRKQSGVSQSIKTTKAFFFLKKKSLWFIGENLYWLRLFV